MPWLGSVKEIAEIALGDFLGSNMTGAILFAALVIVGLIFKWLHPYKNRIVEPSNLIFFGLIGMFVFSGIALGGYMWQQHFTDSAVSHPITMASRDASPIRLHIVGVNFSTGPNADTILVDMRISNIGPPSIIKEPRLAIYIDGELFEQFPPREFSAINHTTMTQILLATDPLPQGSEIAAGLQYNVLNNAKAMYGKPGTVYRIMAKDVEGRAINAEYKVP
jgi:hypothetical protein